ncbi:MAG: zinc-binding dehydrogenase [Hyphomicrobiales bacterium]|nr:Zn-dependent alcohol dehydrogenase [Hyphomicrobiales bacterium]PCJ89477.1 MAG: zinc-binding dehydrogenase [Hyphomicrobiales bacterium]
MQTRAALCHTFGEPLTIEPINIADPAAQEVLVDVAACAICHSDIIFMDGGWGGALPAVYGHEASGIVRAVGQDVRSVAPGDHVVVTLIRACGDCHDCNGAHPVRCDGAHVHGASEQPLTSEQGSAINHGLLTGAFAEHALVHQSQICKIPKDFPLDLASLLACGVITGLGAVFNTAKIEPGCHVAIIGTGGVGLNSVQGAVLAGAGSITAMDIADSKLQAAKVFGATHTINVTADDMAEQIANITKGRGFDYVFITVGVKRVMDAAFDHLAYGGSVVIVGMLPNGVMSEYDPGSFAYKSQRILGSRMGESCISRDIPMLIELYQQGRLKLDELVSGRYEFEQINEAIESARAGEALRNVVLFPAFKPC